MPTNEVINSIAKETGGNQEKTKASPDAMSYEALVSEAEMVSDTIENCRSIDNAEEAWNMLIMVINLCGYTAYLAGKIEQDSALNARDIERSLTLFDRFSDNAKDLTVEINNILLSTIPGLTKRELKSLILLSEKIANYLEGLSEPSQKENARKILRNLQLLIEELQSLMAPGKLPYRRELIKNILESRTFNNK